MRYFRALLSALALLVTLMWSGPASSQLESDVPDDGPIDQVDEDENVLPDDRLLDEIASERIVELYEVSLEDARHQMDLQEPAAEATVALTESIPTDLQGGFHIDRHDGGALVVSLTGESDVEVDGFDVPIVVRTVPNSLVELQALSHEIQSQLGEPAELSTAIDVESNTVELNPYAPAGEAGRELASRLLETYGANQVSVGQTYESWPVERPCSPDYVYCSRPLRGGVTILNPGMNGWCTQGFIVESIWDAKAYTLTAGHCADGSGKWRTRQYPSNTVSQIGSFWSDYNNSATDAGIIKVDNPDPPTGWQPASWVNVKVSDSTTANATYPINSVGSSAGVPDNYMLCTTVTSAGTGCGPLTAIGVQNGGTGNLGRVELSTCQGDSGAPFYKVNKGFGILKGGIVQSLDNVVNPLGLGAVGGISCGGPTFYVGLGSAMGPNDVQLP